MRCKVVIEYLIHCDALLLGLCFVVRNLTLACMRLYGHMDGCNGKNAVMCAAAVRKTSAIQSRLIYVSFRDYCFLSDVFCSIQTFSETATWLAGGVVDVDDAQRRRYPYHTGAA